MDEVKLTDDAGEMPQQVDKETEPAPVKGEVRIPVGARIPPRALGVPVPMPTLGHGWVPPVWSRR